MSVDARIDRPGYPSYVLSVLGVVYLFNFIDRNVLSVLIGPIKREFQLSDTQMGFLTGPAFAVVYAIAGIPLARWADRGIRRSIIALALGVWSLMTALSGAALGFWTLALARIGVGIGEAGGTPPSHSLISDYFPAERRGRAIAIYSTANHAGVLFGMTIGAYVAEAFGWRLAFLAVGLPGLLLAALVRLSVAEPIRGRHDAASSGDIPPIGETLNHLARLTSFRWLMLAAPFSSVTGYAFAIWGPELLTRTQGVGLTRAGTIVGLSNALGGVIGTLIAGTLIDALARRDLRWYAWVSALSQLFSTPFFVLFLFAPAGMASVLSYGTGLLLGSMTGPAQWAMLQALAPVRMRAMAVALVIFSSNLIGLGGGPLIAGFLNDKLEPSLGAEAVRWSLLVLTATHLFAAAAHLRVARSLRQDIPGKPVVTGR